MVEFKVGDKVIYPLKGIGEVIEIKEDMILDNNLKMYKILLKEMEVYVPINEVESLGIRLPLTKEELEKVFHFIEIPDTGYNKDWIKRLEENKKKSLSGDPYQVAEVIKVSTILAHKESLNKYEKELLTECKKYFIEEISYILNCSKELAKFKFEKPLKKLIENYKNLQNILANAKKLYAKEKYFQAINDLLKVVEQDKNNIEAIVYIADCYNKLENKEKAEEYFEMARKIDENDWLYNLKYGYYIFNKNKNEALEYFKKASVDLNDPKEKKDLYVFLKNNYEE
ncbi:MAG TPA: CarD family transcriptional regulator [bacterium]|nr:CarD family transcriptional regulator [bacterium]HOL47675.1 CarD family transcriptional regulator [bacterium]HPQ18699.1 CarD family transcriptional regulator [bacterium]